MGSSGAEPLTSSCPIGRSAAIEENVGGPDPQIHGLGDAVARERSEDERVFAAGMPAKDGLPVIGNANRPTPTMREFHASKRRVKFVDAVFESLKNLWDIAGPNIESMQVAPILKKEQPTAKHDGISKESTPQIREVHGVERLAVCNTDVAEDVVRKRFSENRSGEGGMALDASKFKRKSIRGE